MLKMSLPMVSLLLLTACSGLSTQDITLSVYHTQSSISPECQQLGQVKVRAASAVDQATANAEAEKALEKQASDFNQANTLLITNVASQTVEINFAGEAEGVVYLCPK